MKYLDPDVAQWLQENVPKPRGAYKLVRQYLSDEHGLRRLIASISGNIIGAAGTCRDIDELKSKMEELYGSKRHFQFRLQLLPEGKPDA